MRTSGSPEDRVAIVDVTVAYCWALDSRDWAALEDVFLPDATAELASPLLTGLGAIQRRIAAALAALDDTQHVVTNHQIAVDGDTARSRCYLQAQHVRHGVDGGENFLIGGRYEDDLARTQSGWRIRHRRLVIMWSEGNPAVFR